MLVHVSCHCFKLRLTCASLGASLGACSLVAVCRLHEFVWHGSDASDPGVWRPKGLTFTKLRHVPDYLYYNVSTQTT